MILTETHSIKLNTKTKELFTTIDSYSLCSKNLRNYTNYIIKQCSRISYKLKRGEILDSWEKGFIYRINCAIYKYNHIDRKKPIKEVKRIDETNGFISNAYFLAWYLKDFEVYKQMPFSTSAQICIQMLCSDWKAFYASIKLWKVKPELFLGKPKPPGYCDKETGRFWVSLTYQNIKVDNNNYIELPKAFSGIKVKARHTDIKQVRITTTKNQIKVQLLYKQEEKKKTSNKAIMGIDLNVDNLTAIAFSNNATPIIIDGKPLKSNNQWYNKEKARLQKIAKKDNDRDETNRMSRLTQRRNNKVKDYLHKVSCMVVDLAIQNNIGTIVIGNNQGWKQEVNLGKKNNQNFVGIPYLTLIEKITYKASLVGIKVEIVDEAYTSGTSYLDGEMPIPEHYNKKRRKTRGCFRSNSGELINADINGAYQIIKKYDNIVPIKHREKVVTLKVA